MYGDTIFGDSASSSRKQKTGGDDGVARVVSRRGSVDVDQLNQPALLLLSGSLVLSAEPMRPLACVNTQADYIITSLDESSPEVVREDRRMISTNRV